MSDEEQVTEEVTEQTTEQAPPDGGVSDSEPEKKGKEPVEMSPEVQRRFNQLYRESNDWKRAVADLRDLNAALFSKIEEMDTARANDHRQQTEASLMDQIAKATQRGDMARVAQLQGQLIDIKAEAKARDVMRQSQPKPQPKQEQKHDIDPDMVRQLQDWADELNGDGTDWKRPYAQPGHPLQRKVAALGQALMEDPAYGGDMSRILPELDRQMTKELKGRQTTSAVLPSNTKSVSTGVQLTPEQATAARNMGLTPEKYARQMEVLGRTGAAVAADFRRE